jgi:hypothetical protein
MEKNTALSIIEMCGGHHSVAKSLNVTAQCVWNWETRGIPRSRYLDMIDIAEPGNKKKVKGAIAYARSQRDCG